MPSCWEGSSRGPGGTAGQPWGGCQAVQPEHNEAVPWGRGAGQQESTDTGLPCPLSAGGHAPPPHPTLCAALSTPPHTSRSRLPPHPPPPPLTLFSSARSCGSTTTLSPCSFPRYPTTAKNSSSSSSPIFFSTITLQQRREGRWGGQQTGRRPEPGLSTATRHVRGCHLRAVCTMQPLRCLWRSGSRSSSH